MEPYEHPCKGWEPASEEEWERFWRLVKFEADHEPDRVWHYQQLDEIDRERKKARLQELAESQPSHPGALSTEQALSKLQGVRKAGSTSWLARCPLHEDHSPSLMVSESEMRPGQAYVQCFAGCDWKALRDWLKA